MTAQRILLFTIAAAVTAAGCNSRPQRTGVTTDTQRQVQAPYELVAKGLPGFRTCRS